MATGPSAATVKRLFALSRNQCAFPGCPTAIIDGATGTVLGEVCHIHGQNVGGPRYEIAQNEEQRHAFENLVLLCSVHHKIIDAAENVALYPPERVRGIKQVHEARAAEHPVPELSPAATSALALSATTYEAGAVHMDFRQAQFRVGGEGGAFGGGGGGGGILTIVGLSRLPPDVTVDLDGRPGDAPGGGGGGGGVLRFEGRTADESDELLGLKASSFFVANAASVRGGLLSALNAGWSYCPLPTVPQELTLTFGCIVEGGRMQPSTLLRVELSIVAPDGQVAASTAFNIGLPDDEGYLRRSRCSQNIQFSADAFGVWTARISSGPVLLANYPFEIRLGATAGV